MGKAIAIDSPWIRFGLPDKSPEYFALLYCRPLNKYRAIPGFLRFASQIQMPHLGPTKFTKWNVLCSVLPLGWEEAMQRSKKGEPS